MRTYEILESPTGKILILGDETGALTHVFTGGDGRALLEYPDAVRAPELLAPAVTQLREYLAGTRREFDLRLAPTGSDFQKQVWAALCEIPFGETRSYGQIAARLGVPNASRAVGRANATNPISIIVPCHRVIGSNGTLTGYAGGLPVKRWLLEHEGVLGQGSLSL